MYILRILALPALIGLALPGLGGCAQGSRTLSGGEQAFTTALGLEHAGEPFISPYGQTVQPPLNAAAVDSTPELILRQQLAALWDLTNEPGGVAKLKRDGRWGAQLALQAMIHWKLGEGEAARRAARRAAVEDANIPARDAIIASAIPGLVDLDELDRLVAGSAATDPARFQSLIDRGGRASVAITTARARSIDHMMEAFLIEQELRGLETLRRILEAGSRLEPAVLESDFRNEAERRIRLLDALIGDQPGGEAVIRRWLRRIETGIGTDRRSAGNEGATSVDRVGGGRTAGPGEG